MKPSIRQKLDKLSERFEEVGRLLSDPEVLSQQNRFRDLSIEYSQLEPVAQRFREYVSTEADLKTAQEMADDSDTAAREMGQEESLSLKAQLESDELELKKLLVPRDPRDDNNVYLEVRAGTGGDEAAIFAGDLFRMYARYAESRGWTVELINESHGEHGGYKEVISRIVGRGGSAGHGPFSRLKFESGTHRVQRVPATETQGRIHTSACTIAILPELQEVDEVVLNPADLRIDTYRASGAGGQHVNKTDSAIRITHIPTGTVVECQDERSQHKNRSRAMALLKARLLAAEQEKQHRERALTRKLQIGSGDRSERIRTYNFPQGRVTDHRINLTLYRIDEIVNGKIDELVDALTQEHQAEQLAEES